MTAQGHPRAIFRRAIERGNLLIAETTLRELGRPTLLELLDLTALIAQRDPRRRSRVAARWLLRTLAAKVAGLWALAGGAVGAATTIYDRHNIDHFLAGRPLVGAFISVGWGLNLALVASMSLAVAGIAWMWKFQPSQ